MRSFIKTQRMDEGHKIRAEYPYTIAFDLASDLRAHLEDGLESVPLTMKANDGSPKRRAALEAYKKAASAIVPLLGRLEDALSDIEDSV